MKGLYLEFLYAAVNKKFSCKYKQAIIHRWNISVYRVFCVFRIGIEFWIYRLVNLILASASA